MDPKRIFVDRLGRAAASMDATPERKRRLQQKRQTFRRWALAAIALVTLVLLSGLYRLLTR